MYKAKTGTRKKVKVGRPKKITQAEPENMYQAETENNIIEESENIEMSVEEEKTVATPSYEEVKKIVNVIERKVNDKLSIPHGVVIGADYVPRWVASSNVDNLKSMGYVTVENSTGTVRQGDFQYDPKTEQVVKADMILMKIRRDIYEARVKARNDEQTRLIKTGRT